MTKLFSRRLAFLLLLSFSWQSLAASLMDCPSMPGNASTDPAEHASHHQHAMHQMTASTASSQKHTMPHHSTNTESTVSTVSPTHPAMTLLSEHHCIGGCVCDFCGVASVMLENDFNSQLSLLPGSVSVTVIGLIVLPAQEVPLRPPIPA